MAVLWPAFDADQQAAEKQVVIASAFLASRRAGKVLQYLAPLAGRGSQVRACTKPIDERPHERREEATRGVEWLREGEIVVYFGAVVHEKIAPIDGRAAEALDCGCQSNIGCPLCAQTPRCDRG